MSAATTLVRLKVNGEEREVRAEENTPLRAAASKEIVTAARIAAAI